jgi:hypothetical protein
MAKLLEAKITYWRQRSTIIFTKFGDENTKVFYAMATHTKRKKHIGQLTLQDGSCLVQHREKAEALWQSFKARLNTSDFMQIHYDMSDLI